MPISVVPTAPIPVHTAYAVPIGRFWIAFIRSSILTVRHITNPTYHKYIEVPVVSFAFARQEANATSNNPAKINTIQFITFPFVSHKGLAFLSSSILQMIKNVLFNFSADPT